MFSAVFHQPASFRACDGDEVDKAVANGLVLSGVDAVIGNDVLACPEKYD